MKKVMLWIIIAVLNLISTGSLSAFQQKEPVKGGLVIAEAKLGKEVKDKLLVDESSTFTLNERVFLCLKVTGGPNHSDLEARGSQLHHKTPNRWEPVEDLGKQDSCHGG